MRTTLSGACRHARSVLAAWPIRTCRSPVVAPFGKETTADLIAAIVSETLSGKYRPEGRGRTQAADAMEFARLTA